MGLMLAGEVRCGLWHGNGLIRRTRERMAFGIGHLRRNRATTLEDHRVSGLRLDTWSRVLGFLASCIASGHCVLLPDTWASRAFALFVRHVDETLLGQLSC